MEIAQLVAQRSTCSRLQVGAIIARDFRIISSGYNGAPAGLMHCYHDSKETSSCDTAVHAEINAILAAAKHGVGVDGADLYVTHFPCRACAQAIINSGIKRVYYAGDYRIMDGMKLLDFADIRIEKLEMV